MYDIEKDIENVATVLHNGHNCMSWKEAQILARAALNASTAVTLLKEAELSLERYALLLTDAHEDIAIAERRIRELEAMNEWQPIETAPTNGVEILICLPRQGRVMLLASYNKIHKHWVSKGSAIFLFGGDLWKPLSPPKQKD